MQFLSVTDAGRPIGRTPEELILSGKHMCSYKYEADVQLLITMVWTLNTVLEVLALCLSAWIAAKHFRDLRRLEPSTGSTIRDCFRVLIKSHVLYFARTQILWELSYLLMFVLGPRLILSIRKYQIELVAGSDADTSMASIVFQGHHGKHLPGVLHAREVKFVAGFVVVFIQVVVFKCFEVYLI
ncbi:hypothetical protein EDB19DRAFT_1837947 [Suillus lakei]|nr:hypothetical protein EDB19DRAFT_1837947 [Suillus lakei]